MDTSIIQQNVPIQSITSSPSLFESIQNISISTWIIIVLILSFLGFNVFVYLAKGTEDITKIIEKIFGLTASVTGEVVNVSAQGAKAVVNSSASALTSGLDVVQQVSQPINNNNNNSLNKPQTQSDEYEAQESSSSLKAGWCFIGEDRGYRSCSQVGINDTCMSGDIFPTQDVCVNPTLRK
jgi:hypothetical protein